MLKERQMVKEAHKGAAGKMESVIFEKTMEELRAFQKEMEAQIAEMEEDIEEVCKKEKEAGGK